MCHIISLHFSLLRFFINTLWPVSSNPVTVDLVHRQLTPVYHLLQRVETQIGAWLKEAETHSMAKNTTLYFRHAWSIRPESKIKRTFCFHFSITFKSMTCQYYWILYMFIYTYYIYYIYTAVYIYIFHWMRVSGDISATIRIHLVIRRHEKCLLIVMPIQVNFMWRFCKTHIDHVSKCTRASCNQYVVKFKPVVLLKLVKVLKFYFWKSDYGETFLNCR